MFSLTSLFLENTITASLDKFQPQRIKYDDLVKGKEATQEILLDALSNVGLVSIIDIPSYLDAKRDTLSWKFQECVEDSVATQAHTFFDGTVRRTLATHTVPGPGGVQKIEHKAEDSEACSIFSESSDAMRSVIAHVTDIFASRLSSAMELNTPIMATKDGFVFETIKDVVENGEHLEHFHSYQSTSEDKNMETINWHTDQGFFVVFTPGQIIKEGSSKNSEGFFIKLQDESLVSVELNEGDLVFMLGDGVNQYINSKVNEGGCKLRATPHALFMPSHEKKEARVWYGRMVLPPPSAFVPEQQKTHGELRQLIIDASTSKEKDENVLELGCSSSLVVRNLEETVCAEGSMYCWHRCMNYSDHYLTPEICKERNLEIKCVNPRGQLYEEGHGDYYLDCSNATEFATPYPTLPGYPRNEDMCSDGDWQTFNENGDYSHCYHVGEFNKAVLCWTVDGKFIDGRLAFNGLFGFIALGFVNLGGGNNGMCGASVIMGIPGGNYSAATGVDLSMESTVEEYVIGDPDYFFRHWSRPVPNRDTTSYNVESNECFTSLTFKTDSINGKSFNVTGVDYLIWSANGEDSFAQYHGLDQRNKFYVEWSTGKAGSDAPEKVDDTTNDNLDHDDSTSGEQDNMEKDPQSTTSNAFIVSSFFNGVVMSTFVAGFSWF